MRKIQLVSYDDQKNGIFHGEYDNYRSRSSVTLVG